LAKNSILYIYSDGPKNKADEIKIKNIREYIKTITSFKKVNIIERNRNLSLANSVIKGVTEVVNKHKKVIVLEDDLVTSPYFLNYMNKLLEKYEKEKKVYSITGYNFPNKILRIPKNYSYSIYFNPRAASWGWATWKNRWQNVDWDIKDFGYFIKNKQLQKQFNSGGDDMSDMLVRQIRGKLDSWAIRWCYHHFKHNALCIYPIKSYVNNIGLDESGVHCGKKNEYNIQHLNNSNQIRIPKEIVLDKKIVSNFKNVFKRNILLEIVLKTKKILKYMDFRK